MFYAIKYYNISNISDTTDANSNAEDVNAQASVTDGHANSANANY